MSTNTHSDCLHRTAELLQQLNLLQEQMQAAIKALAQHSLADLELSLWRQEMVCAALHRSMGRLKSSEDRGERFDLKEAARSLGQLNRTYGAVVKESSRSLAALLRLGRLYGNSVPTPSLHHFSREV